MVFIVFSLKSNVFGLGLPIIVLNLVRINEVSSSETNLSAMFRKYFREDRAEMRDIRYVAYDFLSIYNQSSDLLLHETKKMGKQILKELGLFYYESYIPQFYKQDPSVSHIKSSQKGIVR